jgi:hypothetical protein
MLLTGSAKFTFNNEFDYAFAVSWGNNNIMIDINMLLNNRDAINNRIQLLFKHHDTDLIRVILCYCMMVIKHKYKSLSFELKIINYNNRLHLLLSIVYKIHVYNTFNMAIPPMSIDLYDLCFYNKFINIIRKYSTAGVTLRNVYTDYLKYVKYRHNVKYKQATYIASSELYYAGNVFIPLYPPMADTNENRIK